MKHSPAAVVAPPALVYAAVLWAALWLAGVSPLVAVAPAAAVGLLIAAVLWLSAPKSALRALGARPLVRGEHLRLENLVDGLCTTHGFHEPAVHVVETSAINAASAGLRRPPSHLIVTCGALSGLDRLELEAVVARQLCEIKRGVSLPTVLASVSRLPGAGPFTARLVGRGPDHDEVTEIDIEAVRLTSYPPALASAMRKVADGPDVDTSSAVAHLWFVAPRGVVSAARAQPSTVQRVDVLDEI